jgi:integrative and conjugative element protein (TIGR02256 family)
MALTEGHFVAIEQLKKIESHDSGAIEIVSISSEPNEHGWLQIEISMDCSGFSSVAGGLPLNHRERVHVCVPSDFPFSAPSIWLPHARFALFPHVQWRRHICLFASQDLQWYPHDGMFGIIQRLGEWFKRGALNELDVTGEPLHPPSIFVGEKSVFSVCIDINLPRTEDAIYKGAAILSRLNSNTFEILEWKKIPLSNNDNYSALLILKEQMPFEYPDTVWMLFQLLKEKGIDIHDLYVFLKEIAIHKKTKPPMFLFICTPMIGIKGSGDLKYHIACWEIDSKAVNSLRKINNNSKSSSKKQTKRRNEAIDEFFNWASSAKVKWCTVYDNRPEISIRRDYVSPVKIFNGKRVIVWGCGALGANVAIHLARAGVSKLTLIDDKKINPGVLVRQPFYREQCGINKAVALKDIITKTNGNIEIEAFDSDISDLLNDQNNFVTDFLIDCTASNQVHLKSEKIFIEHWPQIPLISMCVDNELKNGIALIIGSNYHGAFYDVYHKAIIAGTRNEDTKKTISTFISLKLKLSFQPVPGCSEPTFTGASTDAAILSAKLLNASANVLLKQNTETATSIIVADNKANHEITHEKDICFPDSNQGYSVHITDYAWKQILEVIKNYSKKNGRNVETGGFLYGERNDILKTICIDISTPPPKDSKASELKFVCGIEGVQEENSKIKKDYFGTVKSIGSWHTHPQSIPYPSATDILGIGSIIFQQDCNREKHLLVIIQPQKQGSSHIGAYLFLKENYKIVEG